MLRRLSDLAIRAIAKSFDWFRQHNFDLHAVQEYVVIVITRPIGMIQHLGPVMSEVFFWAKGIIEPGGQIS